eukprot:gene14433-20439_t
MMMEDGSCVHVKAISVGSRALAKTMSVSKQSESGSIISSLSSSHKEVEERLNSIFQVLLKLGDSVSPWGVTKNAKRTTLAAAALKDQLRPIKTAFSGSIKEVQRSAEEIAVLRRQLADRDEKCMRLYSENQALQSKVSQTGEGLASSDGRREELEDEVEDLREKLEELHVVNTDLQQFKDESANRHSRATYKTRHDLETANAEIERLKAELRKTMRTAAVRNSKDMATNQLASRTAELRVMQRKFEQAKSEAEVAKAAQKTTKASLDEANTLLNMSQDETLNLAHKLAACQKTKDELEAELDDFQRMDSRRRTTESEYLMALKY